MGRKNNTMLHAHPPNAKCGVIPISGCSVKKNRRERIPRLAEHDKCSDSLGKRAKLAEMTTPPRRVDFLSSWLVGTQSGRSGGRGERQGKKRNTRGGIRGQLKSWVCGLAYTPRVGKGTHGKDSRSFKYRVWTNNEKAEKGTMVLQGKRTRRVTGVRAWGDGGPHAEKDVEDNEEGGERLQAGGGWKRLRKVRTWK